MKEFARSQITEVTPQQWVKLERLCRSAGAKLEEAQLRSATGMSPKVALKVILRVAEQDGADLYWLVFHDDHFATRRRFDRGFQPVPWRCPDCEDVIEDEDELRYEMQAVLREPLRFV